MRRISICFLVCFFLLTSIAFGFDLVEYSPLLSHFEVRTTEDVILVFDSSLDPATITDENVYLETRDGGAPIAATLNFQTTAIANDTLVLDPAQKLPFGVPIRIVITPDLLDTVGANFSGVFPQLDWFVPNIPTDLQRPAWDPADFKAVFVNSNVLLGFNPMDPESYDPAKPWMSPGIAATEAWKIHTGRPEIIVAAIDNGLSTYEDEDLIERFFLNRGELPLPMEDDVVCAAYDCNDDGRFSVSDYALDLRVVVTGKLDPTDLIAAFSNNIDDDNNGFADDICGWDFFRDTNVVLGVREFPEGTHASLSGKAASAIAGNNNGNKPGVCPDCSLLPIRVSDAVIADLDLMAEGSRYAVDLGAKVLMVALGSIDYSQEAMDVFEDAYENGVVTVAASGDELGYHHIYPAAGENIVNVHGVLPIPAVDVLGPINLGVISFVESYCTNYGAHTTVTVSTGACTSEAVGNGAGLAGLIFSYALEQGIELSAGEVIQLMNMSADDIKSHCITITPGGCKPGWDQHWGYGRVNAYEALKMIGWPELGIDEHIPPNVEIVTPKWWENINPFDTPTLKVTGKITARGRTFDYELQAAFGVEPDDAEFVTFDAGSGTDHNGLFGTINLWDLMTKAQVRARPQDPNDFTVTVRVQARYTAGNKSSVLGEARKAFAVHADDHPKTGLMEGFPKQIEASGEASPVLYDLDGAADARPEIILSTSNGQVHAYHFVASTESYEMLDGFPVVLPNDRTFPDGIVGTPAVGALFGDGVPIIVAATFMGRVYAIWPDGNNHEGGPFLPGFPVEADERPNDSALAYGHGRSFLAAPAIADLDGDGLLEIIAASYDQHVYAWKPVDDNNDGIADMLSGWPVLARSEPGVVEPRKECDYPMTAQILGSPAVAILDTRSADPMISEYPAVIVPTAEVCSGDGLTTSRVYAIYPNGYDHSDGPFLPGWPSVVSDPAGDEIPIPPLTIGATSSPAVYYDDAQHKAFIGVGTFFWFPIMLVYENENVTPLYLLSSGMNLSVTANGSFGFMGDGEAPHYFFPTAGFLNNTDDVFLLESFNVSGWKVGRWRNLAFRKRLDDINFFVNPVIADLDNDGLAEVISGSSGYIVHAWNVDGDIPAGWPKFTQNFHIGSMAVGDLDLNGSTDVVSHTHEGNLFAWNTLGTACRKTGINAEWWSFHHDEHNTGTLGTDTIPPGLVRELTVYTTDDPDVFEVTFIASGNDWQCGFAAGFDIRYATDAGTDLTDPMVFESASALAGPVPEQAGNKQSVIVTAPDAAQFAIRTFDDNGLISRITPPVTPQAPPVDDDDDTTDDDDDDDAPDPSAGDDDDDDEACCG